MPIKWRWHTKVAEGIEYCNSLLDMYARCDELEEARAIFEDLKQRGLADLITYTSMIGGRCQQ